MEMIDVKKSFDDFQKEMQEVEENILFIDGYCVLRYGGYDYNIELSRLKTERDLLSWVLHLTEKNWMDSRRLMYFIANVARVQNLDVRPC